MNQKNFRDSNMPGSFTAYAYETGNAAYLMGSGIAPTNCQVV
jgi:hypothetical protein